ncbi:MAG: hypothetical protein ACRC50_02660 [Gaiella sp.]
MRKPHAFVVSLMIAASVVAGVFAVTRTVSLGQASKAPAQTTLAQREAALDRAETQIAKLNASVPPRLPAGPTRTLAETPVRVVYAAAPPAPTAAAEGEDDDDGAGWEHESDEHEEAWDD